jgi:hypothetical protein
LRKTILLVCIFLATFCFAQDNGRIRGFISNASSGEVLPFANVLIQELSIGTLSDSRGSFLLTGLPFNKELTLIVSFVGFNSDTVYVTLQKNRLYEIEFPLEPKSYQLGTIEVLDETSNSRTDTDISIERIDVKKLQMMPRGVEVDIFRSLTTIPGVRFVGDISSKYYVRGGLSDQNLVLFNGVTVYNPFHAMGLFSVLDPDMINSLEFLKGGFGPKYGGRLSSVMDIRTKDGNKFEYSGKASISLLTNKILFEGPFPNGSFLLTARKSFSNEVLKKFFNKNSIPLDFYDFSVKATYMNPELFKYGKIQFFGFFSSDNLDQSDITKEDFMWKNNLYGFKWIQFYNNPFFLEVTASLSQFYGEVFPRQSTTKARRSELSDFSIISDLSYTFNNSDVIWVGNDIKIISTNLLFTNSSGLQSDIIQSGGNFSVYVNYELNHLKPFLGSFGLRTNISGISDRGGGLDMEPRFRVSYALSDNLLLKAAWGIYKQEIATAIDDKEVISLFEPWLVVNGIDPSTAVHNILGLYYKPTPALDFDLEAYYKRTYNQPTINENKIFDFDPDLVSSINRAYGLDLAINYKWHPLEINLAYSYGVAEKEVDNQRYFARFDSRHNISLSGSLYLGSGWNLSSIWLYTSGRPFTQHIGFYDKLYLNNLYLDWWTNSVIKPFLVLSSVNTSRLPEYHRLDINLSKKFSINKINFFVGCSLINVYNRNNIFYFTRDTGERVDMLPFLPSATLKIEI